MFEKNKITDEELAEDYAVTNWEWYEDGQRDYIAIKQAFLAGLKAGRPQWHKMDYKDEQGCKNIPCHIELLTKYDCGLFTAHCINKWAGDHWCEHRYSVIAWCEILE